MASDEPAVRTHALVVAELFTSEGCSSCPPADDLLTQTLQQQPLANVEVLGLGEHVDYWDRLGWRDPFSSAAFTNRQAEYEARVFHTGSIYTPQVVVDGRFQEVGSDAAAVRRVLAKAAQLPKAAVVVSTIPGGPGEARLHIRVDIPPDLARQETADVVVAITEDHLVTDVHRGENGGRTLKHSAVARTLVVVGSMAPGDSTLSTSTVIPLGAAWKRADLRAIGLLQGRQSRRVIGVGTAGLAVREHTE